MFLGAPTVAGSKNGYPTGTYRGRLYELPDASPIDHSTGDFATSGE
jgi:hypothetical protein